jgi:hypothetical protein
MWARDWRAWNEGGERALRDVLRARAAAPDDGARFAWDAWERIAEAVDALARAEARAAAGKDGPCAAAAAPSLAQELAFKRALLRALLTDGRPAKDLADAELLALWAMLPCARTVLQQVNEPTQIKK